jgi:hypothetical protein
MKSEIEKNSASKVNSDHIFNADEDDGMDVDEDSS